MIIQPFAIDEYDAVVALWQATEGVGLSGSDTRPKIAQFLERNPGLSFVAYDGDLLAGAVLCGHDGRRGYIHHLAVRVSHRRRGIGRQLVERCLSALEAAGIDKCHLFVFAENQDAVDFWKDTGWVSRVELAMMSRRLKNAD